MSTNNRWIFWLGASLLVSCGCVSGPHLSSPPVVNFSVNDDGGARVFIVNHSRKAYLCEIRQSQNNFRRMVFQKSSQPRFPADSPEDQTYFIPLDKNVFSDKRNTTSSSMGFFDLENIRKGSVSVVFASIPVAENIAQSVPDSCPVSGTWRIDGNTIVLSFRNCSSNDLFVLFGDEATGVDFPLVYIGGEMRGAEPEPFEWIESLKPVESSFPVLIGLSRMTDDSSGISRTFSIPVPEECVSVESVRLQFSVATADHILSCKNTGEMLSHFYRFTEIFTPVEMAAHKEIP